MNLKKNKIHKIRILDLCFIDSIRGGLILLQGGSNRSRGPEPPCPLTLTTGSTDTHDPQHPQPQEISCMEVARSRDMAPRSRDVAVIKNSGVDSS